MAYFEILTLLGQEQEQDTINREGGESESKYKAPLFGVYEK